MQANIFKYELSHRPTTTTTLSLPLGSTVLHAAGQYGHIYLWVLFPGEVQDWETRNFMTCYTGVDCGPSEFKKHVSTFTASDGLVYHIFEV